MKRRPLILGLALAFTAGWPQSGCARARAPLTPEAFAALYANPLPRLRDRCAVFHLGHSLVGRDMPAMLAQLARHRAPTCQPAGLGRLAAPALAGGTGDARALPRKMPIPPFARHMRRWPRGDYDAVVLTEMVEIRDAIRYHDSARYLAHWARKARARQSCDRGSVCMRHGTGWMIPRAG